MPSHSQPWHARSVLVVVALVAMALHLRPGATAIGPVLAELQEGLGFGDTFAGLLTALPGLGFAVVGAFAAVIGQRLGINLALTLALVATGIGLLARAFMVEPYSFAALTMLAISGMAVGNVLVPPFIKEHFGLHTATMTSVYTVALALGALLPTALTGVLLTMPGGWRTSIGVWGATTAVALIPWLMLLARERATVRDVGSRPRADIRALLRSRTAVMLALFFGIQSMHAYVQFGWLAQAYRDGGLDAATAGLMISILLALGIPTGLMMPRLVARVRNPRPLMVGLGIFSIAGFLGVLYLPTVMPWLWATSLGLSGGAFPTAIALITLRTRDSHVTMQVSSFVQSFGYLLAAAGPFAVGLVLDITGSWTVPLIALAASGVLLTITGILATTGNMVDDDISPGAAS